MAADGGLQTVVRRAVHASPVPAMVVDLATYEVVDANAGALRFFEARDGRPVDLAEHLTIDPRHRDMADLVASGRIEGFDARLQVDVGSALERVHVWVRAVTDDTDRPRFAVVMVTEGADIDPTIRLPLTRPTRMVAGATDDEWVVAWVTQEITAVLGYDRAAFVGTPLLAVAHPDSAADLVRALLHAAEKQGGAVLHAQLRRADHRWRPLQMILSPRPGDVRGAMFLLLPAPDGRERGDKAVHDRVWRAAGDVHAAALAHDGDLRTDAATDLSSRQWEIVTRLRRGERVPGIAGAMYLSQSTVRNHLTAVFRKFGVHSQSELLEHLRADEVTGRSA